MNIRSFLARKKVAFGFVVLGAAAGFLYYQFVGCQSGSCAITSSPIISTLYGGLMGWFAGDLFSDFRKKQTKQEKQ